MDYLDCVFHVFVPELRERYRWSVWGEAPRLELGAGDGRRRSHRGSELTGWGVVRQAP